MRISFDIKTSRVLFFFLFLGALNITIHARYSRQKILAHVRHFSPTPFVDGIRIEGNVLNSKQVLRSGTVVTSCLVLERALCTGAGWARAGGSTYGVYLRGLAELHELLGGAQQRQMRVADEARQTAPLAQRLRRRRLRVPLHARQLRLAARADAQVASVQVHQPCCTITQNTHVLNYHLSSFSNQNCYRVYN